ncbi:hypothetical protein [Actinoplanes sp. NPDC048796]|uniref:hypothetical protein n=1 Tax=Actinoplanes sp. NPDC048796 TaxID=3155640 RepID=UPI0033EE4464
MERFDSTVRAAPGSVVNFVQGGDLHVYRPDPGFRLDPLGAGTPAVPEDFGRQPSRLLADAHRFVAFHGRVEELERLGGWRDAPDRFGVMLIHGTGGQGKTRLAGEFAVRSVADGWTPLTATPGGGVDVRPAPIGSSSRLVVVDYAERWPVPTLRALLADKRLHERSARILLLARPSGGWWRRISRFLRGQFGVTAEALALGPLPPGSGQRERLFEAARDGFARALDIPGGLRAVPPEAWSENPTALEIQMAALAAVYAADRREDIPSDPGVLSAYLLEREYDHWSELHERAVVGTRPETMARIVYLACLAGPLGYAEAAALLTSTGLAAPGDEVSRMLDDHRMSYPADAFAPIQPDRMAEDYVALQSTGHRGFETDPWTAGRLPEVLAALAGPAWHRVPAFLAMAVSVAQRWPAFGHEQLGALLRAHPEAALAAGGPVLSLLAGLRGLDVATLSALEAVMPMDGPPDLMEPLAVLTRRLYRRQQRTDPVALYAPLAYRLARRLLVAGHLAEAEEPVDLAIAHWARRPGAELARAYGCRAEIRAGLGRLGEALQDSRTSLALWREARVLDADRAAQLGQHALLTEASGLSKAAARYQADATELWRRLADGDEQQAVRLARSLSAEATYRRATFAESEAAAVAREAAETWLRVNREAPDDRYLLDLIDAWSAVALSRRLPLVVRLEAADRAVTELGRLSQADVTLLPRAARALSTWAVLLAWAGRRDQAVERLRTAYAVSSWLIERDGRRNRHLHAAILLAYSRCCGDPDDQRAAAQAAERLYRGPDGEDDHDDHAIDEIVAGFLIRGFAT